MTNGIFAAAAVTGAFFFSAVADGVAAEPGCGSFSLIGGEKVINVVDNPPEGPSPGDVRAGNRPLLDENGNRVADVHFSATLTALPTAKIGSVFVSQYFVKFADGWITTTSVYELSDATDTSQRAGNAILLASDGTGTFENAKGRIVIEAGDPPTYVFDLNCR